jgi:hypothetical protein
MSQVGECCPYSTLATSCFGWAGVIALYGFIWFEEVLETGFVDSPQTLSRRRSRCRCMRSAAAERVAGAAVGWFDVISAAVQPDSRSIPTTRQRL